MGFLENASEGLILAIMAIFIIQPIMRKPGRSGKEFSHIFYVISRFMQIILCIKCENIYKTVYKEI